MKRAVILLLSLLAGCEGFGLTTTKRQGNGACWNPSEGRCVDVPGASCPETNAYFQSSTCAVENPAGACSSTSGAKCFESTKLACDDADQSFTAAVGCDGANPLGACYTPGACHSWTEAQCAANGGSWSGGQACSP